MKLPHSLLWALLCLALLPSCRFADTQAEVASPGGVLSVKFFVDEDGAPFYRLLRGQTVVVDTSRLGFAFQGMAPLDGRLVIVATASRAIDETWEQPWGEQRSIRNRANELRISLQESVEPRRMFDVVFRVYDDGIGFRYEFPQQPNLSSVVIADERTQFRMAGDHTAWWTPADFDSYEHLYTVSKLSALDATPYIEKQGLAMSSIPNPHAANTPLTLRTAEGLHISLHEADLTNYAGMTLAVGPDKRTLSAALVPAADGSKVKATLPFRTPWRTIQVAEQAADLVTSYLILNLNEPNKLDDTSWITPMKYMGIWWEMHLNKSTWHQGPKHGATTANAKYVMDFAAQHGIKGLLVEGWNTGWEHWLGPNREGVFDFTTPYPDFDIEEVVRYGREKGVALIGHHETAGAVTTYEQRIDSAFAFYRRLGVPAVKTGYVGSISPKGEHHHGQWMVNHYQRVVEKAAAARIMLDVHEPIKPTGLRRTYPNMMTREGVRGTEFNAWGGGNPPSHIVTLPFTRMLAGPIDYTPGIFNIKFDEYNREQCVKTTLANQLAQYVLLYSPLQMAADLVAHYEGHPMFRFIAEVGVDWETTRVIHGQIGEYATIVRQERGTGRWFLGSATNEEARTLEASLDFLAPGKRYKATIYADGPDAHWDTNPTSYQVREETVDRQTRLSLVLAPGGGQAISFEEIP
jgi:alpha-glucosidase